jgi:AcrR family transcriptional regulator
LTIVDAPAPTRSTRHRPAKAPLSEAAIVEAALVVTRAKGLEAVTMRRVAAELDTGAASLYVYVRNRDELVRAMLDHVSGTVPLATPDPARWRAQVHDLLSGIREALESYPGLAAVLPGEPPTTENTLAGAENLLALLLAGGIRVRDAAWACDIHDRRRRRRPDGADAHPLRRAAGRALPTLRRPRVRARLRRGRRAVSLRDRHVPRRSRRAVRCALGDKTITKKWLAAWLRDG